MTGDSQTDVGTNAAAVQETTTAEETTTAAGEEETASVTFNEQQSDGEKIVIESVTMPEGGFIAIHDESLLEGDAVGSVIGNSVYLEAGTHEDVTITLGRPIEETQTLIAMPHFDTNDNEVYDFVISAGERDGPYTTDGQAVTDQAEVTVGAATTTEVVEETTTEEVVEETTTAEVAPETTTEEVVEETTTEEVVGETTTEEVVEETTTEEVVPETTTEEVVPETTTEEVVEETTTVPETTTVAAPAERQFIFKIEQMNIDEWSFVVGDEETPDRTEVVSDVTIRDRRVNINLTEVLQQGSQASEEQMLTTQSPEEVQERIQESLSQDIETVRFVIRDVTIENVTFVITAPEGIELPPPPTTVEETTTEEVVEETTTEEVVEETTTAEVVEETTTEEVVEETTTAEVVEETTTAAAELSSFDVSELDAPENATVGDTITVSAVVSNPNDQEATQDVAFRLEGTVIARKSVTLDPNEETTVEFEIDTSGVPAGQYIHGVYTRDFGELAIIALEEPTAETTTAEETTTVEIETTTEEA